jgi:hypothetical protein
MVKALTNMQMELSTLEIGVKTSNMGGALKGGQTEPNTKVNTRMVRSMGTVS